MLKNILQDAETRMKKTLETLLQELGKLRTGRAHPGLLETIVVPYYGSDVPLSQVANITVEDPRTLTVTPWEKNMVAVVDKAIRSSDLGLNPASSGMVLRIPLPPLTEERRRDLVKHLRSNGEDAKVAVRNIRRDANTHIKELLKRKEITEDDERRSEEGIQKITDKFIAEVDKVLSLKETELMQV